jgi:ABC-2 type transport system permease protein
MKRFGLVRKTLRDVRGATIAIAAVLFITAFLDWLIFPSYREQLQNYELPDYFRGFLGEAGSMTTPEGFLNTEFFSWIPLLLITLAIIGGTGALAGEEGAGTLDLLLAQPVTRTRLVLEKTIGLALAIAFAAVASFLGFLLGTAFVDIAIGLGRVWSAVLNMIPITLLFLALSLWGSAALPSRGAAALLSIGVVVAAYFLYMVGATVTLLETPRKLSPFYWADGGHVLLHGFDWARAGGLLAVAALLLGLALWSFQRRDIGAGAREWGLGSALFGALTRHRASRRRLRQVEAAGAAPGVRGTQPR